MVRLLLESVTAEQKMFVLAKPREALGQAGAPEPKRLGPPAQHTRQSPRQTIGGARWTVWPVSRTSWIATAGPL